MKILFYLAQLLALVSIVFICSCSSDVTNIPTAGNRLKGCPDTISYLAEAQNIINDHPLSPPNTSSPQATLQSFVENMNFSYKLLMDANSKNRKLTTLAVHSKVKEEVKLAEKFFARAVLCLDLSKYPNALQQDIGLEKALQLKEIFDRIQLPLLDSVPDLEKVILDLRQTRHHQLLSWRIPHTRIVLTKMLQGSRKDEYLFSAQSLDELEENYQQVKSRKYKDSCDVSPGFYFFYVSTPGLLMPPKWSHYLPEWSKQMVMSQTIWQLLAFIFILFFTFLIVWLLHRFIIVRTVSQPDVVRYWGRFLFAFLLIVVVSGFYVFLNEEINLTGYLLIVLRVITDGLFWILSGLAVFHFLVAGVETVLVLSKPRADLESTYLRAICRVVFMIVGLMVVIYGLSEIGVSLVPLITGAGIGGIAIALAARSTLANIISSFTIYIDKPYRVGDEIKVMEYSGTVETIGIRSTSIRLPSGHLALIPNEKMAASEIENFAHRHFIKRVFNIRIAQGTEPEKIEKAIALIREILAVGEGLETKTRVKQSMNNQAINEPGHPPRVFFNDIENHSIVVYYWFHPPNHWDYLEHANWVNMQIAQQLAQAGIQFTTMG